MLTHELIHMGFPSVPRRHHWIEEGLATYVESIARARAGGLSQERAWRDLVEGMPQGLPQADDRGLDFTPTWGRTYWGGAIFCLLADIEIRKRTENRYGLEHALRAIVKAGGTIESEWKLSRAIEAGDRATGVPVLQELYDRMKASPVPVPLDELWVKLGIATRDGRIVFDDAAPLAHIRKAITRPANPE
jgi:predicted metalloprotease with PDZ domain